MTEMKTWTLKINEGEMRALIDYNLIQLQSCDYKTETSARIHDLTKRLNKDIPEIENAEQAQPQAAPKEAQGWM